MAKHACKCKPAGECEECPEWIFTFADLVMLMMGFFVILWVLKPAPGKSSTPEADEDWLRVAAAIRQAFDYLPDPKSNDPVDRYIILQKLQQMKPLKGPGDGGRTKLEHRGTEGPEPEVLSIRPGQQAVVGGKVLFALGDAALLPEGKKALDGIADVIRGKRNIILVKGHTALDDLPEDAGEQQNVDLSIRRSRAALEYLVSRGVSADTLRVVGCGTHEPVAQRAYTAEMKQLNRRVEVEATATLVAELQDPAAAARPATQPASPGAAGAGTPAD